MKHKTPTKRKIHKTLSHREESEVIDERYKNMPILLQDFFIELAQLSRFTVKFFLEIFKPPFEFREIFNQAYKLGYQSLFLVGLYYCIRLAGKTNFEFWTGVEPEKSVMRKVLEDIFAA